MKMDIKRGRDQVGRERERERERLCRKGCIITSPIDVGVVLSDNGALTTV